MKIAICGWYGAGNLGDEAILSAIIEGVRTRIPDCTFHVFSKNPDRTSSDHQVESSSLKLLALPRSLEILKGCDAFILGGGVFLHKYSSSLKWMSRPTIAQMMRIPVVFYALGVDRTVLQSRGAKRLIGGVAKRAKVIIVRDENSRDVLLEMGVKEPIEVTVDPVFSMSPPPEERIDSILRSENLDPSRYVLVCPGFPGYRWDQIDAEKYTKALVTFINHIVESSDAKVVLVPFEVPWDLDFCDQLKQSAGKGIGINVLQKEYPPKDVIGLFSSSRFVVCSRYHANIFSIMGGVPFVSIMYLPGKHTPLLDFVGMTGYGTTLEELTSSRLTSQVSHLLESEREIRSMLEQKKGELKEKADRNVELLLSAL
ncbi:MAG: polysaccharide pyruvyl transferase family protein [Methanobacteriota archaeon]|nr:MAG: polysaccharide pyruvyl transferase family protein [Euryarchaeota archaeon]